MNSGLQFFRQLKGTFAAFVATGVAVIFVLGSRVTKATAEPSQQYLLIAIVVALMFVYGLFLWVRSRANLSTDADGETFYYLGFIFTLATLVATFMPLLWTEAKVDSKQVLGLFGLGLITTFVGLAGRIFYSRFSDPDDDSEDALRRVAIAAEDAARSIEAVTIQIRRSGEHIEQYAEESHRRSATRMEEHSDLLIGQLTKQVEQSGRQMDDLVTIFRKRSEDIFNSLQERLDAMQLPPKEKGKQLSSEIEGTLIKLKSFGAGLEESSERLQEIRSQFVETSAVAAQAKDQFQSLRDSVKSAAISIEIVAKAMEHGRDTLNGFNQSVEATRTVLGQGQEQIVKIADAIVGEFDRGRIAWKGFVETSGSLSNDVKKLTAVLHELLGAISSVANAVNDARKATEMFSEGASNLANVAHTSSAVANDLAERNKEAAKAFGELMTLVRGHHAQLQDLVAKMAADVSASHEAVQKVHKNLVTSASFVVQKLG